MMKLAILVAPVALLACADDPAPIDPPIDPPTEPPPPPVGGSFASASKAQLERAVIAGASGDLVFALFTTFGYTPASSCPHVTQDAQGNFHAEGGCTTTSGATLTGAVTFSDPAKVGPFHAQFDALTSTDGDGWKLDGTVDFDGNGATTLALSLTLHGLAARSDVHLTGCGVACTYAEGSTIEIDGIGVVDPTGVYPIQETEADPQVDVHLRAADELTIGHDGSCFTYAGAASGKVCSF